MPADPDQATWLGALTALLGGGGYKVFDQHREIKRLSGKIEEHSDAIGEIHSTLARLDERSEGAARDREEILRILRGRE